MPRASATGAFRSPLAEVARDLNREHKDIVDAVLARDAALAKALMAEHLRLTASVLLEQTWPPNASRKPVRRGIRLVTPAIGITSPIK